MTSEELVKAIKALVDPALEWDSYILAEKLITILTAFQTSQSSASEDISTLQTTVAKKQGIDSGATTARPATPKTGQAFFDTTLGTPIWYNGTKWVDATGTEA